MEASTLLANAASHEKGISKTYYRTIYDQLHRNGVLNLSESLFKTTLFTAILTPNLEDIFKALRGYIQKAQHGCSLSLNISGLRYMKIARPSIGTLSLLLPKSHPEYTTINNAKLTFLQKVQEAPSEVVSVNNDYEDLIDCLFYVVEGLLQKKSFTLNLTNITPKGILLNGASAPGALRIAELFDHVIQWIQLGNVAAQGIYAVQHLFDPITNLFAERFRPHHKHIAVINSSSFTLNVSKYKGPCQIILALEQSFFESKTGYDHILSYLQHTPTQVIFTDNLLVATPTASNDILLEPYTLLPISENSTVRPLGFNLDTYITSNGFHTDNLTTSIRAAVHLIENLNTHFKHKDSHVLILYGFDSLLNVQVPHLRPNILRDFLNQISQWIIDEETIINKDKGRITRFNDIGLTSRFPYLVSLATSLDRHKTLPPFSITHGLTQDDFIISARAINDVIAPLGGGIHNEGITVTFPEVSHIFDYLQLCSDNLIPGFHLTSKITDVVVDEPGSFLKEHGIDFSPITSIPTFALEPVSTAPSNDVEQLKDGETRRISLGTPARSDDGSFNEDLLRELTELAQQGDEVKPQGKSGASANIHNFNYVIGNDMFSIAISFVSGKFENIIAFSTNKDYMTETHRTVIELALIALKAGARAEAILTTLETARDDTSCYVKDYRQVNSTLALIADAISSVIVDVPKLPEPPKPQVTPRVALTPTPQPSQPEPKTKPHDLNSYTNAPFSAPTCDVCGTSNIDFSRMVCLTCTPG